MCKYAHAIFTESHIEDLRTIYQYAIWVRLRRRMHQAFYQPAHWVSAGKQKQYHWV